MNMYNVMAEAFDPRPITGTKRVFRKFREDPPMSDRQAIIYTIANRAGVYATYGSFGYMIIDSLKNYF